MMVIGIDAHKRSHTAVTVDEMGRQGVVENCWYHDSRHLRLLKWAPTPATTAPRPFLDVHRAERPACGVE
jgi:hypothetical protein